MDLSILGQKYKDLINFDNDLFLEYAREYNISKLDLRKGSGINGFSEVVEILHNIVRKYYKEIFHNIVP